MRRSNSLLKNLGKNRKAPEATSYAQHPQAVAPGVNSPHAMQSQPVPPAGYAPQSGYAMQQMPMGYADPGSVGYAQPRAPAELQQARNTLESLIGRLNSLAGTPDVKQASPQQNNISNQLGQLTSAITAMQSELSGLRNARTANLVDDLKPFFREIQEELRANLPSSQLDPGSLASIVETSHEGVLNEIRSIQNAIGAGEENAGSIGDALQSHHDDLTSRVGAVADALSYINQTALESEFPDIKEHLVKIESLLSQGNTAAFGAEINERLEEVTAAVLAISGNANQDNLDRIEARVIELSKTLDEQVASLGDHGNLEPSVLEQLLERTHSALSEIDQKLSAYSQMPDQHNALMDGIASLDKKLSVVAGKDTDQGTLSDLATGMQVLDDKVASLIATNGSDGEIRELASGMREVSERLSNLSVVVQGLDQGAVSDGSPLLERLDQLVANVETLTSAKDHTHNQALDQQLGQITSQLQLLLDMESMAGSGGQSAQSGQAIFDRLDQISQQLDGIGSSGDPGQVANALTSLDQQMAQIMGQLQMGVGGESASLEPIVERMESLEQQFGASRDIGIELAAGVAEEAVRKALAETAQTGGQINQELVEGLQNDIRRLVENTTKPGSLSDEILSDIRETIGTISGRLEILEHGLTEIRTRAQQAPAPVASAPQPVPVEQPYASPEPQPVVEDSYSVEPIQPDPLPVTNELHNESNEFEPELSEQPESRELSAGEQLVQAARKAEQERNGGVTAPEPNLTNAVPDQNPARPIDDIGTDNSLAAEMPVLPAHDSPNLDQLSDTALAEDHPIEPGSKSPDLASLVRQANERRKALSDRGEISSGTDFLAAARRAAQAAALEASAAENVDPEPEKGSGILGSLPGMFSKRKSAMALATVGLLGAVIAGSMSSSMDGSKLVSMIETAVLQEEAEDPEITQPSSEMPFADGEPSIVAEAEPGPSTDLSLDDTTITGTTTTGDAKLVEPITETVITPVIDTPSIEIDSVELAEDSEPVLLEDQLGFVSPALRDAAMRNDPKALFEVARRLTSGEGVAKNLKEAARIYEEAAKRGMVPAQYIIGNFYEKGVGVERDRTIAGSWYEQAADGGHVIAMHNLGVMHASPHPETGKKDQAKAVKWFRQAADRGLLDSQVNLGIILAKGGAGIVDLAESYKWFALAAKSGDKDATSKRDLIANALRPEQLEDAKQRIVDWKKTEPIAVANAVEIPEEWKNEAAKNLVLNDPASVQLSQQLLAKMGFDAGPADGVMGNQTKQAIRMFRERSGLPKGDSLDTELLAALKAMAI